ncbi:hypothetical protein B0G77_8260 [Paraburkholderia sp. BL10I2N1]|nr:hypothetical protein B0G77_8260 [Paraburkholderia sp. BL10I2N1]
MRCEHRCMTYLRIPKQKSSCRLVERFELIRYKV